MADDLGVMDLGTDIGLGSEPTEQVAATADPSGQPAEPELGDKSTKAYRDAIKAWRDSVKDNPEMFKHAKRAYDDHGRLLAIQQLEPKGVDGVREVYNLIQSAGGPQAITEMQTKVAESDQQNELWSRGDPKAFEAIPPEWDKGLAKLAPQYLDRIQKADPDAYASAMLPRLMGELNNTVLPQSINAVIDALQSATGTPEEKLATIKRAMGAVSGWWNQQEQRAGQLKSAPKIDPAQDEFQQQRTQFEKERSDHFWNTQVWPESLKHQQSTVEANLKTYQDRLKLPEPAYKKLVSDVMRAVNEEGAKDSNFSKKMELFRGAKSPDAAQIKAHVKFYVDKYAKPVVDRVVDERYGNFLKSRPGPKPGIATPARPTGPGAPITVASKPATNTVDWNATKRDGDIYKHVYVLTNGKTVKWNKPS